MGHLSDLELGKEIFRMLSIAGTANYSETILKAACRACGLNKVLLRLPEIFNTDKKFFVRLLTAYRKKINVSDCLESLDMQDMKNAFCKKCSSTEIAEMLANSMIEEEKRNVRTQITDVSTLNVIFKKIPRDLLITHTVANEELIPPSLVLDIALQNNGINVITNSLETQLPQITKKIFEKKITHEAILSHIEDNSMTRDKLLSLHKAICAKLTTEDLLDANHDAIKRKLINDKL